MDSRSWDSTSKPGIAWVLWSQLQVRRASFIHELLKENLETYETAEDVAFDHQVMGVSEVLGYPQNQWVSMQKFEIV